MRKILLMLMLSCIFVTGCSSVSSKANQQYQATFNDIKGKYDSNDYLGTIGDILNHYDQMKNSKYVSDINKIYETSINKLLDSGEDSIVIGITNRPGVTFPEISKQTQDRISEVKNNNDKKKVDGVINEIVKDIDNKDYTLTQYDKYKDNKTISNLLTYATMLSRYKDYKLTGTNNVVTDDIALLDPYYTGVKSDEINQFVAKFMNKDKWIERNSMLVSIQQKQDDYNNKPNPTIGMTQQEVLNSKWGKPNTINKTTTAYGVNEQWVYNNGYLYFDNGKLTAIQN